MTGYVKTLAPQAVFNYCHVHSLSLVFSKECYSIKEARILLGSLSLQSSKRTPVLYQICDHRLSTSVGISLLE